MQSLASLAVILALASGALALLVGRFPVWFRWGTFALLGVSGVAAVVGGGGVLLSGGSVAWQVPLGLPWMRWHMALDPLSGFFLALVGLVVSVVSLYGPGYVREYEGGRNPLSVLGLFTGLFVAGMYLVTLAADAFAFMVAWELMSLGSYFLVAFEHCNSANRRAGFLYLLMAHVGALSILLAFGVLAAFGGGFDFESMAAATLSLTWSSLAFGLALLGFGMKAGLVPLHVWLPEAHPVAPSHISALMSGVMLKVAVYGFVRVTFDLIGTPHWGWGVVLLVAGSISALFGVLYALVQHDLKRLLAYHSVENIGIIFMGLGLSAIFLGTGYPLLGALGLVAALFHCLNHALFKSLLFLGAGAILQHAHERDLEHMGGLLGRMPWTGAFFLVGCISISALPPFNGFASEWLTFQAALQAPVLESGVLRAVIPIGAAMLALTGALAAACFVKVYGVAFLGQARTRRVRHAREAGPGMVLGQGVLALLCLFFGVFASPTVEVINGIANSLLGAGLTEATSRGWLWLTPIAPQTASYSAPLVAAGVALALGAWVAIYFVLRPLGQVAPARKVPAWDCGFGPLNARMQYTAGSFAMPIRRIFAPVWRLKTDVERETVDGLPDTPAQIRYQLHAGDVTWDWLYQPIERTVQSAARRVSLIQSGQLRHYLIYSFATVLVLLWLVT